MRQFLGYDSHWNSFQRSCKMKTVFASVLIATACFLVFAEAQQTTLKPTTPGCTCGCTCGPTTTTTMASFLVSRKPTTGTTLKPTPSVTTTKPATCTANPKLYCNIKTCSSPTQNTLCQYSPSSWGASCDVSYPAASAVNTSDIALILDLHNNFRRKVAQGFGWDGVLSPNAVTPPPASYQPPASNMRQMYWDYELACMAEAWVHQCQYRHDQCRDVPRFKVGQNIFIVNSSYNSLSNSDWNAAVKNWYHDITYMNPSNPANVNSFPNPSTLPNVIDRYTQLVWANSYLVGCATAYFQSSSVFQRMIPSPIPPPIDKIPYYRLYVCNYGPAGNIVGSPIYSIGTAGSSCPTGTVNNNGLCA